MFIVSHLFFSIIKTLRVSFNVLILKWNGLMSSHVLLLKVWHWFCSLPKTSMWERVWERCHRQGGKNQLLGIVQKLRSGFSLVLVSQILYETKIKQTLGVMSQTAVSQVIGDPKSSPWLLPSGNLTELWKITSLIVKSATHDPFSIAMLLYWRVVFVGDDTTYLRNHPKWCWSNHGWDASGPIRNHPRNQPSGGGHVTLW
jgi:hypothetical protein